MDRTRRRLLAGVVGSLGGIAGCTGSRAPEEPTPSPTSEGPNTSTSTPTNTQSGDGTATDVERTPTIATMAFESGSGQCGSSPSASIQVTEDGVQVTGRIVTPTPCYRALLRRATIEDGTARFVVGARASGDEDVCVECLGEVPFDLRATFSGEWPKVVVVAITGSRPTTVRRRLDDG